MVDIANSLLSQFPNPEHPYIAHSIASHWKACQAWSLYYLSEKINNTLKFRLGKKHSDHIQWEPNCPIVYATIREFTDWINDEVKDASNPFAKYPKELWWAYADYIYMSQLDEFQALINDLAFQQLFPFLPSDIIKPTFWLGSSRAHTICHRDTYGVNLVVQINGTKRWLLFPPSDNLYMYESRIPLEESTVFSKVNFPVPNFKKYPLLTKATPYCVTLHPGDILYVPRHWWHFVESTTTTTTTTTSSSNYTCSVNLWIDQPSLDNRIRFKEGLTQLVGFSLLSNCCNRSVVSKDVLHPTELKAFETESWFKELLDQLGLIYGENSFKLCNGNKEEEEGKGVKRSKIYPTIDWKPLISEKLDNLFPYLKEMKPTEAEDFASSNNMTINRLSIEQILNAFMKPDVIDLVAKHLENDVIE
uniref:JmjC domain-containing protein n=1 Tax=Trichobilharzia regenti TaxID=157069 RepID=A0AA85K942_TRIRE|nr:unnamed protein product [Trichobilharzia regenti]